MLINSTSESGRACFYEGKILWARIARTAAFLILGAILIVVPHTSSDAGSRGVLQICKKDKPGDHADPEFWYREVIIPAQTTFSDVGTSNAGTAWAKLRILTLEDARLSGKMRCARVRGEIGGPQDWGTKHVGPVVRTVRQADDRLLEVLLPGRGRSAALWPWADVPPIEATVATDFK